MTKTTSEMIDRVARGIAGEGGTCLAATMDLAKSAIRGEPAQSVEALCRYKTCTCLASARAAIAAHEAALAEAGYVIVPREANGGMLRAAFDYIHAEDGAGTWRAMCDAATEPAPDNPSRDP